MLESAPDAAAAADAAAAVVKSTPRERCGDTRLLTCVAAAAWYTFVWPQHGKPLCGHSMVNLPGTISGAHCGFLFSPCLFKIH